MGRNQIFILNERKQREHLKERFLECLGAHRKRGATAAATQEVVRALTQQGVSRMTLVAWALQAGGYTKAYASNLISRIMRAIGLRARQKGAGRKPSPEVLELLAHAQAKYGERFLNVLRAAWRAGKDQAAVRAMSPVTPSDLATETRVVPSLGGDRAYNGSVLSGLVNRRPSTGSSSITSQEPFSTRMAPQPNN